MVRAVIDGETIEVATFGRVRLLGVDAPQAAAPFAREARERLAALVLRRWVRLDPEPPTRGVRGGHFAYVVRDDGLRQCGADPRGFRACQAIQGRRAARRARAGRVGGAGVSPWNLERDAADCRHELYSPVDRRTAVDAQAGSFRARRQVQDADDAFKEPQTQDIGTTWPPYPSVRLRT